MLYRSSEYLSLPSNPGVYRFLNRQRNVIYIGKAKNLKSRVASYFASSAASLGEKTKILVNQVHSISITVVESEIEALLLEAYYIKKYKPRYNIKLADDKFYPFIRINLKSEFPAITISRNDQNPDSVYFGPFPSSKSVHMVLRLIRRIFPFQSVLNHPKRICLYHHLGLCPCLPVFSSKEEKIKYAKNLQNIIAILEGKARTVLKKLEKKRDRQSKNEKFEEALILQKQIDALKYIIQPIRKPFEYDLNPNLREDLRKNELDSLKEILNTNGYNLTKLNKIECFDISHTQGKETTASLVVFKNGEKDSSSYRRFKIKHLKTPDDFASMQEVLRRRLKHQEWELPNLIIVDGGKGQVASALKVLEELSQPIPLIGLAKREETIVISQRKKSPINTKSKFIEISLPKETKALHLIMRIRDEAHRFAVTYHRKLRSKSFIS